MRPSPLTQGGSTQVSSIPMPKSRLLGWGWGHIIVETTAQFEANLCSWIDLPTDAISLKSETTVIGSKTTLQRLNPRRRRPRTYPYREHFVLTKSVGQYLMERLSQGSAQFNTQGFCYPLTQFPFVAVLTPGVAPSRSWREAPRSHTVAVLETVTIAGHRS